MNVGLFGFYVWLLGVKAKVADAFVDGKTLGEIKKLWKYSFTSVWFGNKNWAYPPNFLILISEKHSSNRFAINFLYKSLSIIGLDQILHCFGNKFSIKYFIFSLHCHCNHKLSHSHGITFFRNLKHFMIDLNSKMNLLFSLVEYLFLTLISETIYIYGNSIL